MRMNLPVTGRDVSISDTANILSTTDLNGDITYVNPDFIKISGFDEDELLGQHHNIVRHPDMPREAFADLWSSVRGGNSWMGMVKNRCKNGDHYWVSAFVTPISRNGRVVEYQSVRTKPQPAQIAAVAAEFEVSQELLDRWRAWLADDRYWPTWTTVTHGEIYPAHQVMEGPTILGLLDWTTAAVGDPARDFAFHQASVSPEAFDLTVDRYVENGGKVWPKLAEHCAHLFSTAAVDLGLFALETGEEEHLAAAREQLGSEPAA